jgi:prevent-host-death family protein
MPATVSAKDIQKNYRKVFEKVKKSGKPVVVLTNNTPDVAVIGIKELDKLYKKARKIELLDALSMVDIYKKEKNSGKLKKLNSLSDLM